MIVRAPSILAVASPAAPACAVAARGDATAADRDADSRRLAPGSAR